MLCFIVLFFFKQKTAYEMRISDWSSDVCSSDLIKMVPYKIAKADNGDAWVEVNGQKMAPPQISAEILKKMKKTAEDYLGEAVTEAVITVQIGRESCRERVCQYV